MNDAPIASNAKKLMRPESFRLFTDSNGNAALSVAFRRENIPYLAKVLRIVDRMMAADERFDKIATPPSGEDHPNEA